MPLSAERAHARGPAVAKRSHKARPRRERIDWAAAEVVYVRLPRCYYCNSRSYQSVRSEANGDGTSTLKAICNICDRPFKVTEDLEDF